MPQHIMKNAGGYDNCINIFFFETYTGVEDPKAVGQNAKGILHCHSSPAQSVVVDLLFFVKASLGQGLHQV